MRSTFAVAAGLILASLSIAVVSQALAQRRSVTVPAQETGHGLK
jgi:hypothetical protein